MERADLADSPRHGLPPATEVAGYAIGISAEDQRFQLAWQHAPAGMAIVDERGYILDVNRGLCELTMMSHDDLVGRMLDDVIERLDDQRDATLTRADGSTRDVQVRSARIETIIDSGMFTEERAEQQIVQFVDISLRAERQRQQEALLEQQRTTLEAAESLERFKSSLVSTVSHELRTPLSSMIGYLELLVDDEDGLSERQRQLVDVVERNSERLLSVVENLLIASGLEHGGLCVGDASIDAADLVQRVFEIMKPLAQRADIALTSETDDDVALIAGDRKMLERVLVNLISNGIKFTPPGGRVHVTSALSLTSDDVVIEVSDTGMGIPSDEQSSLFRRYFRTRRANEEMVPGTGLGLSITAELVRAHGGMIDLRSELGVGTTVSVSLPSAGGELSDFELESSDRVCDVTA